MDEPGVFEIMHSLRTMRRLKPDPVPVAMIEKILDAGIRAPSGQNTQPWAFLVLRDAEAKEFFGSRYHYWLQTRFGDMLPDDSDDSSWAKTIRTAMHLGEHMHEVPVILAVCGKRDWPFVVPKESRLGKAPPSYGSVYPCVQNILLACRALGLGASLTTMHQMFEEEMCEHFGIPDEFGVVAVIPIGFPKGKFGPVSRRPASEITYYDHWGNN
jgi:nitroreductase